MYRVDANSRWQIHCSGPDFTWIIYTVSKFHGMMHTRSCVQGICACREACRLARISCHVEQGPKWSLYKGSGRCFTRFLRCVEVYHDLDHLDVLYRGIHAYSSLYLHWNHVVSRCSGYHRPCISFIFFLLLSSSSVSLAL